MFNDPKTLVIAFLGGIIPALIWLWFWLREDKRKEEPKGLLAMIFLLGMVSVIVTLPIQKFIRAQALSHELELTLFATTEEIIKFLVIIIILFKSAQIDEPIDWPIYMITGALGFAAFENMLYLIEPVSFGESIVGLLTGQLRFLGSTLLHTVSSGIVGISLGLSFHMGKTFKNIYLYTGLIIAIILHSLFNFFIMNNNGSDFLKVYAFLWVVTVIIILIFEKLRRMV